MFPTPGGDNADCIALSRAALINVTYPKHLNAHFYISTSYILLRHRRVAVPMGLSSCAVLTDILWLYNVVLRVMEQDG